MSNNNSFFVIAKDEYIRFVKNPRLIIIVVTYLIVRNMVIDPMLSAADEMNQPLNIFELPVAVYNSWICMFLIVLSYIVLMSSFPSVNDNQLFYIQRMGRKKWIIGEILFQFASAISYTIVITLTVILSGFSRLYVLNGWSIAVTEHDKLYNSVESVNMSALIPAGLQYQITPYKAMADSILLLVLFLILCNMLFLCGCMYARRILFFFIQVAHIAIGFGVLFLKGAEGVAWLFPMNHSILYIHYRTYFRKYALDPYMSVSIYIIWIILLMIIIYRRSKRVSIDMIGGSVF